MTFRVLGLQTGQWAPHTSTWPHCFGGAGLCPHGAAHRQLANWDEGKARSHGLVSVAPRQAPSHVPWVAYKPFGSAKIISKMGSLETKLLLKERLGLEFGLERDYNKILV